MMQDCVISAATTEDGRLLDAKARVDVFDSDFTIT